MKLKRRTELLLGIAIILLILGVIAFNILKNTVDEDKMLAEIREAGVKNDIAYLKDHMEMVDGKTLDETTIKDILNLMKKEGLEFSLNTVRVINREGEETSPDDQTVFPVYFKKDGRHRLFYNKYKLVFNYYDLIAKTNLGDEKLELYIDGKKIEQFSNKEGKILVQNLMPGRHKYELRFGEGMENKFEEEFNCLSFDPINPDYDLYGLSVDQGEKFKFGVPHVRNVDIEASYYEVYSSLSPEYGDVYLYIDGKKTDKIINLDYHTIGPVFKGDKIKVYGQIDIDGKTYRSREIDLSKEAYKNIDLEIKYDPGYDFTEDEMYELMNEYIYRLTEAINIGDFGHVAHTIDPDGPLYEMQRKLVNNLYEKGTEELVLNFEYLTGLKKINNNKYQVTIKENHRLFYQDKEPEEVSHTWLYTISIKNDRAYVNKLEKP